MYFITFPVNQLRYLQVVTVLNEDRTESVYNSDHQTNQVLMLPMQTAVNYVSRSPPPAASVKLDQHYAWEDMRGYRTNCTAY